MEPEGQPQTPGTSDVTPPLNSAQNPVTPAFLNCTLQQSSCSSDVSDALTSTKGSQGHDGDVPPEQTERSEHSADPARSAQRRFGSSAFSSSLSWDEKETRDEEELQHFSNPQGLAAHSPGSPSSGSRVDSEDDEKPVKLQHSEQESGLCVSGELRKESQESTIREEPNTSQLGPTELGGSHDCNISAGAEVLLCKIKPKDACQMGDDPYEREEEGKDAKDLEGDVYTFMGDSDPESPPHAPDATHFQRCRQKRVLLRPFTGTLLHTSPEAGTQAGGSPRRSINAELAPPSQSGGSYHIDDLGKGSAEEPIVIRDGEGKGEEHKDCRFERGADIFTCVECSIYFNKQVHLKEHMIEHRQTSEEGSERFECTECGWDLPDSVVLADHQKRHQESRAKILAEIEKLNENEKAKERPESESITHESLQNMSPLPAPGEVSDTRPLLYQTPPLTSDGEHAALQSNAAQSPPGSLGTAFQPRAALYRRRFVCTHCNFSTRTSQALANHTKTHMRKPLLFKSSSSSPDSPSCSSPLSSSQAVTKRLRKRARSGPDSICDRALGESHWSYEPVSNSILDSDCVSDSVAPPNSCQTKGRQGIGASENVVATQVVLGCHKNRRFSRRAKLGSRPNEEEFPGCEGDQHEGPEIDPEKVVVKGRARARSDPDESPEQQSAAVSPEMRNSLKEKDEPEGETDTRGFVLRRSNRITAPPVEIESDECDDDERLQRFLSGDISDEVEDEIDEVSGSLRSVERKCPYCPDRFHNGIGLANHVRGHLNRVGVSYNVRHFISPEEVNAIEKRFSYQKKKKKVANFDPSTFSVMHCEFCSAGFDTRAGLSSHARAHLRDFGITNWDVTISPIHILRKLFSSRPDLVIPTAPPRSPVSVHEEDEEEEEEEEEEDDEDGVIEVKLEGETSERKRDALSPVSLSSASAGPLNAEDGVKEGDGEAEEEVEPEHLAVDGLSSSPKKTCLRNVDQDCLSAGEDEGTKVHDLKCELCDAQFESRRDMSSHASSHLQASIDLLCQTAKERHPDSHISSLDPEPQSAKSSSLVDSETHEDKNHEEGEDLDENAMPLSVLTQAVKATPSASCSAHAPSPAGSPILAYASSPTSVVRKAPISSLLPASSPLRFTEHKTAAVKGLTPNLLTSAAISPSKPIWAPHENDAPLNLALEVEPSKDIVCQLCGAWFETRKGLSSHARAHLRHFGVEYSESKGSPIALLNQLMDSEDFKHKAGEFHLDTESRSVPSVLSSPKKAMLPSSSPSLLYKVTTAGGGSTSKATSPSSFGPPPKRLKSSSVQVFRLGSGEIMSLPQSEPTKEIGCEFCGEYFENRKGLSSHARSHLRQMGITEWSVNGSPIDTLREIISRRGLPCARRPFKSRKTPPPSSPGPPGSPLSTRSSPSTVLSRLPFASPPPASKSNSAPPMSSSGLILKLKPEPVQLEVTSPEAVGGSGGLSADSLSSGWRVSDSAFPLNLAMSREAEPTRDIRCEFCGEYFENRKGLSSHARSHLRQMGITEWTVNGSPIDTLRVFMHKRGLSASSQSEGEKKEGAKSPSWANATKTSGGLFLSGYQSSKLYKSPLSMPSSGSRLSKQGLSSASPFETPSLPKIVRISPLGKQPEEAVSPDASRAASHQRKTFSPLPHDFPLKKKPSPDKYLRKDPSCELCGFYFENRKALASHARAHLRQFGVTEWCVNGSPIETLSAWIHSRPQKVLEMHRSYMQSNRPTSKRKSSSPLPASTDSDHSPPFSHKASSSSSSSSQWSSALAVNLVRPLSRELGPGSNKASEDEAGPNLRASHVRPTSSSSPRPSQLVSSLPLQAQVARSELNVRLPRGFERRPLKHPSCIEGTERDSGPAKPPRTSTVPALVPKPPAYPLVKLVGKFYTLKCRFCEVEFHGPLSVQEDWIRHLQQHILKMNYSQPAEPKADRAQVMTDEPTAVRQASAAGTSSTTSLTPTVTRSVAANGRSPEPLAELAPGVAELVKISEESLTPAPLPLPAQVV
ncbi:protein Wiz isoform X2 [Hippocampus comes]|nr:PREDICTED: protein Wiz-like isoform X2 [Hippocampus comes]XP_019749122.1 PREDICTED: protein Wiz-like isoform X2 [Hippocampus comes]XP_019749123.1 PREDICTED: protein Wiz-like isoform X2 [Hippocampus comes]XP_019749124.1 PREDICTED: protein Wiz-like isoform X2 [Hippocampus comes]